MSPLEDFFSFFFCRLAPDAVPLPLGLPGLPRQREVLQGASGIRVLQGSQPEHLQGTVTM